MDLFAYLRKGIASVTMTAMVATFFAAPIASAASSVEDFTDAAEIPTWADEAIEELMDMGVISGNDDGSFAPNRQLNRAEVSKVIVLATGVDFDTTGGPHFPDVTDGAWFYDYVETMYNYGWINGYPDGQFRPGVGINRAELAKMVINAFEIDQDLSGAPHFDDVDSADWFYGYVETAYNYGLMRGYGDGSFGPGDAVTRAQTVKIVYDSLLVISAPVGPADGTLEVVLSPDTPRGTNIPFNATSVPFTTVEMTASDDSDVEISSLTFTRLGLGDNDDFDNVWLEVDGFKVGNDKSVNNDDVVELRFNPPLIVPAGQTIVADVVASLEVGVSSNDDDRANTGHHNRFAMVSADDIVSTAANVVGDFPVEGEEMEIADYEVSQIRLSALGADATIDVGDNFIEIGKFRVQNDSNTNKDLELRALTFKNDGTAELEDSLENVALYVSGEQVSAETIIDGDYVTFRLDNGVTGGYIVEDGDSRIFSMRADIVSAEKDDTINFKVDNFEDIVGVEVGTSFGVKTVAGDNGLKLNTSGATAQTEKASCTAGTSAAEDDCARLKAYTVDSGDLNVSRDPSSLSNQEYAPGSNDVVFMTARVVVDQPMIVDGMTLRVLSESAVVDKTSDSNTTDSNLSDFNAAFDNFRVYINDKLVDSENDFSLQAGGTDGAVTDYELKFNTTFELAGTSIVKLVGNIEDDADTGDKIRFALAATDVDSPEYISTGDQVESSQLLGSAEASLVTVEQSVLIINRTDGLSSTGDSIVAGVDDVTFLQFVLDNNNSGDVNATSVSIQADGTGSALPYTNFTAALFVDGTQQGSARNLSSTGAATFNDISVVIPSAGQKEFTVVVDTIESSANANTANTTVVANSVNYTVASTWKYGVGTACASTGNAVVAVAQEDTATVAGTFEAGDIFTITLNGTAYSHTVVAGDTDNDGIATALAALVTANAAVTATATGSVVTVVAATAGTAHTIVSTVTDAGTIDATLTDANTVANVVAQTNAAVVTPFAASVALPAGTTCIAIPDTGNALTGLTAFAISVDGAATGTNAEVRGTVAVPVVQSNDGTYSYLALLGAAGTDNRALTNSHPVGEMLTQTAPTIAYTTADKTVKVASLANITAGDTLTIGGGSCTVASIDTANTTVTFTTTLAACATAAAVPAAGSAVTEPSANQIQFYVTEVDADNVENGQEVAVTEGGTNLGTGNVEAVLADGDCNGGAASNFLCGATFDLIASGTLLVAQETPVYSDVIISGDTDVEILRVKFDAADDEIYVEDLYFVDPFFGTASGDAEDRVDFKLYSASGQLLQTKQMVDGKLHFELANQDRIRVPKDDVTYAVVKVDARSINEANQTAKRLQINLGNTVLGKQVDVVATTGATGADLTNTTSAATSSVSGTITGDDFVIYKTNISIDHSATQPSMTLPSSVRTQAYRFTVSADSAGAVDLGRITLQANLNGIVFGTTTAGTAPTAGVNADFIVRPVTNGSVDTNQSFAVTVSDEAVAAATLSVDLVGQRVSAGGSLEFALFVAPTNEDTGGSQDSDGLNITILEDPFYGTAEALATKQAATACDTTGNGTGDALCNVIWSDESGSPHSATTVDWLNGFEIDVDSTPFRLLKNN